MNSFYFTFITIGKLVLEHARFSERRPTQNATALYFFLTGNFLTPCKNRNTCERGRVVFNLQPLEFEPRNVQSVASRPTA